MVARWYFNSGNNFRRAINQRADTMYEGCTLLKPLLRGGYDSTGVPNELRDMTPHMSNRIILRIFHEIFFILIIYLIYIMYKSCNIKNFNLNT